jgi:Na+-driven multidrug efflux pump
MFGFLDLGLSRAVTNTLAKLRDAPQAHRARVLLTTFGLNLGIGLMGGVVLCVFGGLMLKHFVSMPDEISAEVSRSLPWIAWGLLSSHRAVRHTPRLGAVPDGFG